MFYIVKSKDTLYSIAKKSGHNYHELSKFNSIKKPYKITVGQKIWIGDFLIGLNKDYCSIINLKNNSVKKYNSCTLFFKKPLKFLKNNIKSSKICFFNNDQLRRYDDIFATKNFNFINNWYWPVEHKNIKYSYNTKLNNKNIEFNGFKGQPVYAAAAGEVVCITNSLKKYGKLIIIKHNKNYLSIYAFNDSVLVKKKDRVYAKQKIATIGLSSDNNLARLYFEIRYQGKPVNPLNILPKININI